MLRPMFTIFVLILLSTVVRGCGIPYTDGKPASPVIPLYADAADVTKITNSPVRTITYTTRALPQDVYTFYIAQLPPHGWERDNVEGDSIRFYYLNGNAAPAFGLHIVAKSQADGRTTVAMTQTLSGPFGWPDD